MSGWKTLLIENDKFISINKNNLAVSNKEKTENLTFSLEQLDVVIFDNLKTTLTTRSIIEFSNNNVPLVLCNERHDPKSIILPLNSSANILKNFLNQKDLTKRQKDRFWQQIIQQKIQNEINFLKQITTKKEVIEKMALLKNSVVQGDKTHCEPQSAKIYFKQMFGIDFIRGTENPLEAAYHYGTKVIASHISSTLIAYGFHPALGIHHKSQTNYFNLTYDFIEVFRPLIIYTVAKNTDLVSYELGLPVREILINLLNYRVVIGNKIIRLKHAIDIMIRSFVVCLNNENEKLFLPDILSYEIEEVD